MPRVLGDVLRHLRPHVCEHELLELDELTLVVRSGVGGIVNVWRSLSVVLRGSNFLCSVKDLLQVVNGSRLRCLMLGDQKLKTGSSVTLYGTNSNSLLVRAQYEQVRGTVQNARLAFNGS